MKNTGYSSSYKIMAVVLQMVFLMIVIVMISLLVNLFGRSMLSFRDVGNNSFFYSAYYAEKFEEEMRNLTDYLRMRTETPQQDDERYKLYQLRFDRGGTNLSYWYFVGDYVYTNAQKDVDFHQAVSRARELGSYICYDDGSVSYDGNVRHMDGELQREALRLFQQERSGGGLVIAVDTSLPEEDGFAEAYAIYSTYFPWAETGVFLAVVSVMGFVLCFIYITLAAGRNAEDDSIRLYRLDYVPTELLFLAFLVYVGCLITFCAKLSSQKWGLSSALILTGTLVFISDAVLMTLYLCFVRKIKADIFISCSLLSFGIRTVKESLRRQKVFGRAVIMLAVGAGFGLFFAWEALANRKGWAAAGMVVLFLYVAVRFLHHAVQRKKILEGVLKISSGKLSYKLDESEFDGDYRELAEKINSIGEGLSHAVEKNVKNERMKTELITNVSHDIKTPLTSIINYINLIKMECAQNERIENYLEILEKKSLRLKELTEDLLEVSRINSGAVKLDFAPIDLVELIYQTGGEFNEIFEERGLTIITRLPRERVMIWADGSRLWRVVQNLYNNVAKYALKDTRVYVELKVADGTAVFSIKDVSAQKLDKTAQDLSERFVQGDDSRGTEGSGLGLSIARSLTGLMGGDFRIDLDGDLFTASMTFPTIDF